MGDCGVVGCFELILHNKIVIDYEYGSVEYTDNIVYLPQARILHCILGFKKTALEQFMQIKCMLQSFRFVQKVHHRIERSGFPFFYWLENGLLLTETSCF